MVAIKASLALLPLLAASTYGWAVGVYSTQTTCGGDWAPDSTRSGVANTDSSCQGYAWTDIHAVRVEDWDDGCRIEVYSGSYCEVVTPTELVDTFEKGDSRWSVSADGKYTCIQQDMPDNFSFYYKCS